MVRIGPGNVGESSTNPAQRGGLGGLSNEGVHHASRSVVVFINAPLIRN